MHPLSLFPNLFSYPFLAYFILRLVVVYGFGRTALARYKKAYSYVSYIEMLASILLLVGLYTQGALIAIIVLTFVEAYLDRKNMTPEPAEKNVSIFICVVAFALLFLGPGAFALDYPL